MDDGVHARDGGRQRVRLRDVAEARGDARMVPRLEAREHRVGGRIGPDERDDVVAGDDQRGKDMTANEAVGAGEQDR